MAKDIHFQIRYFFLPYEGANLIDINLQTCNLQTGQSMNYKSVNQFQLSFFHQKDKKKFQIKWQFLFHICKWIYN